MFAASLLPLVTLAAGWVDTSRGPACLDGARIQSALERHVGPRTHAEQVTVERVAASEVRLSLRRGAVVVASRELRVDEESCAAAERSITLLLAAWWKLPSPEPAAAPAPAPPQERAPPTRTPEPAPVAAAPEAEPRPAPPAAERIADPGPPPPVRAAEQPAAPAVEEPPVRAVAQAAAPAAVEAPPARWRWSLDAAGVFTFDGQPGWAGMVRGGAGRRNGLGASLDLGIEGHRLDRDDVGLVAVTPWFGTLSAAWEHRFSAVHLEVELGARLYAFAARSFGYQSTFTPITFSPAVAARVSLRVQVWRGLYVVAGLTGGTRLREEAFTIRGAAATVTVFPGFGQLTLGVGVGSK